MAERITTQPCQAIVFIMNSAEFSRQLSLCILQFSLCLLQFALSLNLVPAMRVGGEGERQSVVEPTPMGSISDFMKMPDWTNWM